MHTKKLNHTFTNQIIGEKMVSDFKSEVLNFFGSKNLRKYICICVRCGSENIQRKENTIECLECGKIVTVKP